jgi:hypothetical protein
MLKSEKDRHTERERERERGDGGAIQLSCKVLERDENFPAKSVAATLARKKEEPFLCIFRSRLCERQQVQNF